MKKKNEEKNRRTTLSKVTSENLITHERFISLQFSRTQCRWLIVEED